MDSANHAKLVQAVQTLERQVANAEGQLAASLATLQREFSVDTVEDAQALLKEMETQNELLERQYETAYEAFDEKWGHLLNG